MAIDDTVAELMRIRRSLPPRPEIEEVIAATSLVQNVEREDELRLEEIDKQTKRKNVPEELFVILQEMQRNMIHFQSKQQKKDAKKLLDLESVHLVFDDLILRASQFLRSYSISRSSKSSSSSPTASSSGDNVKAEALSTKDDSYLKNPKSISFHVDPTVKPSITAGEDGDKLNLIKLASYIEVSAKKGTRELILKGKLSDQINWLPDSIGKLSSLTTLDLSENAIVTLPDSIGGLCSLKSLDLHGNKIHELPETIGGLLNLLRLDVRGNQLTALPPTVARLVHLQELDLSSNNLQMLPDQAVGSLISLQRLNIETNDIEEIPHAIGRCTSLKELRADYNRLKALPEAVGRIESLEILTLRYNNIKQLPTTMASLSSLRQLDVSFNELESVPESLCLATRIVKMDVSNNFADLQSLPRSIGNLEMLEELICNNNQVRVLPDSFGMLTRLRVLNVEGNPLVVPPRGVVEQGAQAVVRYMGDVVAERGNVKPLIAKQKKCWSRICFFSKSNKRKHGRVEYAKA